MYCARGCGGLRHTGGWGGAMLPRYFPSNAIEHQKKRGVKILPWGGISFNIGCKSSLYGQISSIILCFHVLFTTHPSSPSGNDPFYVWSQSRDELCTICRNLWKIPFSYFWGTEVWNRTPQSFHPNIHFFQLKEFYFKSTPLPPITQCLAYKKNNNKTLNQQFLTKSPKDFS